MRRVAIAIGLVLTGVAVTLFILFSQTEVTRTLRQGSPVYVLVVGVDEGGPGTAHVHSVAVAVVQPGGRASWISVPRTLTWPTAAGWTSLYALYPSEGIAGMARRLSALLEVPLPYWVVMDFTGLRTMVDLVGGVEVMVETRLVYQDRSQNLFIDIPPGRQTLDGAKALDFVRYEDGDELGRLAREHQLLRALGEKARAIPSAAWRTTVEAIYDAARTNLTLWEALDLARALGDVPPERATFAIVPTLPRAGASSDQIPDLVRLRRLTQSLVRGPTFLTRDEIRVLVLNGTGQKLLATRTGAWLADRGFQVTGTSDADRSNYPSTYLVVREEDRAKGKALLEALPPGVQGGVQIKTDREFDLARVGGWPQYTDVILILGAGFDVQS
ncbi:MAG: LCP family protein [Candidatus Bipolaricaulis sp.]|jgi:LCP family protein required for cell wall assembly|nr:LCP family protein [Candidatus Bipolaricaulis sp.]